MTDRPPRPGPDADPQTRWEWRWSDPEFDAHWHAGHVPDEIRRAVDDGWLTRGSKLLDIGCGDGSIAAWLAAQGYDVTGIDFARSAIERAEAAYGTVPGLRYEVADVADAPPAGGPYDALLDRGCLHTVPPPLHAAYVRNVAAAAATGARFVLLFRIRPGATREQTVELLDSLFGELFDVESVEDATLSDESRVAGEPTRGVVVRLVRR